MARPTATVGTAAGYVGVGTAPEDLAYVAAHLWSALLTAALLATAWDGHTPALWSARPIHLNAPAWPPLLLLLALSVGTAARRLRTLPRWLWLPAVEVRPPLFPHPSIPCHALWHPAHIPPEHAP